LFSSADFAFASSDRAILSGCNCLLCSVGGVASCELNVVEFAAGADGITVCDKYGVDVLMLSMAISLLTKATVLASEYKNSIFTIK